MQTMRPPEGDK